MEKSTRLGFRKHLGLGMHRAWWEYARHGFLSCHDAACPKQHRRAEYGDHLMGALEATHRVGHGMRTHEDGERTRVCVQLFLAEWSMLEQH